MVQEYRLADLARQIDDELDSLSSEANRAASDLRWARTIPTEIQIGRAVALMGEMSMELEKRLLPLIDEWLCDGGSVTRLSQITGMSRPTLTRRKNKLLKRNNKGEDDASIEV